MRPFTPLLPILMALLTAPSTAPAAELYHEQGLVHWMTTAHSAGLKLVDPGGELKPDAEVLVEFRALHGPAEWRAAQSLEPISEGYWSGSIVLLDVDTEYELHAFQQGAFGAFSERDTLRTQTIALSPALGGDWYVDAASGDDDSSGKSPDQALRTLGAAADSLAAGDSLHVLPGIYRETLWLGPDLPTTAQTPIVLKAEGEGVIIDGADTTYQLHNDPSRWEWDAAHCAWKMVEPFDEHPWVAYYDTETETDLRLYKFSHVDSICTGQTFEISPGEYVTIDYGWATSDERAYLRLPGDANPGQHPVHFGTVHHGITLHEMEHVVVDGFEVRHTRWVPVYLFNSGQCVVQRCYIHHHGSDGVMLRGHDTDPNDGIDELARTHRNIIRDCRFETNNIWGMPWNAIKGHNEETCGVLIYYDTYSGNSAAAHGGIELYRNWSDGHFNGMAPVGYPSIEPGPRADRCFEIDIYDNLVTHAGDDAIEVDGDAANVRVWGNFVEQSRVGVSLAPVRHGPAYVFNNTIFDLLRSSLKVSTIYSDTTFAGGPIRIYHNTFSNRDDDLSADTPAFANIMTGSSWLDVRMRNNIVVGRKSAMSWDLSWRTVPLDLDYDNLCAWQWADSTWPYLLHFYNRIEHQPEDFDDLESFQDSTAQELHGISHLPEFRSPAAGDLRLAAGDANLDAGVLLANFSDERPDGAPDIGAAERSAIELGIVERPIDAVPPGGIARFVVAIDNPTAQQQLVDLVLVARRNGVEIEVLRKDDVRFAAGLELAHEVQLVVPPGAPAGAYNLRVGAFEPGTATLIDECRFEAVVR